MVTSTSAATDSRTPLSGKQRRGLLALSAGHALEWFDWASFGLLSVYIGAAYFPSDNPISSTLNALAVFAVGFVMRPVGGIVFGMVADRVGRKIVMMGAIGVTAFASLVIGILPTTETIGVWAGIIVLLMRMLQGLSTGIEGPLGIGYALEMVSDRPGYVAGFFGFFNNLGNLLAPLTSFFASALLGPENMAAYGWRIPFIIGGVLGIIVLWLRRALPETLTTTTTNVSVSDVAARTETVGGIWVGIRRHWLAVVAIVFIVGAVQAYNYSWTAGLPSMATSVFKEDPTGVFAITTAFGIFMTLGALVLARFLDKLPMSKWFVIARLAAIPAAFLLLLYSGPGLGVLATVMIGGGVVLLFNMTIFNVVANSLLPQFCRATGAGIGFGVGVALFGGTASYLLVWLGELGLRWVFPVYVAVLCLISVGLYLAAKRRTGLHIGD